MPVTMSNPLISKLSLGVDLTAEDRLTLEGVVRHTRKVGPREDLIHEGDRPGNVHLVMDGFACRYKTLPNGRRQIMAFLIPGDFCDFHVAILGSMDHGIGTLTPCTMVGITPETIEELTTNHPRISRALWWCTLVDEAILREGLVNMGQRPAHQQAAHVICELLLRLQTVGRATENSYPFPLTQEEFGDALGLSVVHTNRTLQHLRDQDLIILEWDADHPRCEPAEGVRRLQPQLSSPGRALQQRSAAVELGRERLRSVRPLLKPLIAAFGNERIRVQSYTARR